MTKAKFMSCGNDYYEKYFVKVCEALEQGERVSIGIDCIGHTRNNMAQDEYKRNLLNKYGERLSVKLREGVCSYSYEYALAE